MDSKAEIEKPELPLSEIKNLINQKLMVLIHKGFDDKKLVRLNLTGLAKMVKVFRDEGERQFDKVFERWTPDKKDLSLLLKELSWIDNTEPIIVDTTDPKIMLDFFGYEPYLIDEYRTVFESHWRQYFEWAKKGMELKKVLNPKGRPSTEKRDRIIRRLLESNYILKDPPDGENYYIHAISKVDQEIEGIGEIKEGQDFWIVPSKFKPKTMKKFDKKIGYYPRFIGEELPMSRIEEFVAREYNISKKTLQNILSKNDTTILGKRTLFLMPDGRVIR